MMGKYIIIGVDVGNYAIKSKNTTLPSGYSVTTREPLMKDDYLLFNERYFSFGGPVFKYKKDKTVDERAIVFTLGSIAKEILFIVNKRKCANGIQYELDQIEGVDLGVGLPPMHIASLARKTIDYYQKHFENGIHFEYCGYKFNLKLGKIKVYPQDYAAAVAYKKEGIGSVKSYKSYVCIDIGGYTVDVVTIINGKVDMAKSDSFELGIIKLYDKIINDVSQNTSLNGILTYDSIEAVLKGEPTILSEEIQNIIKEDAKEWIKQIVDACAQKGLDFEIYPVLFIGGGSILLRKCIKNSKCFVKFEFITNANANAVGYEALLKALEKQEEV